MIRATASGLVVAEEAQDERAVAAALRQIDRSLALQYRPPYYVVVKILSDRDAPVVFTWMDAYGEPLPLSSGLVEEFKQHRLDAPNKPPSVDERNHVYREQLERDAEQAGQAVMDDHRAKLERGRTAVSLGKRTSKRYWQRNRGGPRSGVPR